ncbi:PREDICTED: probable bifunctional methylenetetrahydrofolate dehydrogenase/cyclohydrolase 2 [Miniopterus natalensis]|uniref:probable bifunctional methylenetetrahydrofolate dehydrogenase/cyclohydrolase 2 n=1 Tax=Miniopterus natalensis TaxID=291302 RepID=UPI0007A7089C|nr:PREDICTED: probable bifunctional methylenetetrahydrofolate dehydrogenase/cyclohydrolase 2 [Miniopterus natalensis]
MAKQIQEEIQQGVESWISLGNRRPHLSIVLVGDNPASHTYVRKKIRAASAVGIYSEVILKPKDVSQEELLDITDQLNMDPRVSGILVQLPLPDHVDERTVCNGIAPEKDVDGFHIINIGRLCLDQHSFVPATASAVWEIIRRTGIETFGKNVVVAGRSKNVGLPIAMLLHTDGGHQRPGGASYLNGQPQDILHFLCENCSRWENEQLCQPKSNISHPQEMPSGDATVTIAHRYTPNEQLKLHTQLADIVIVAAGVPKLITSDMIKEGAAVIDVGINYVRDPVTEKVKLVGDVDFEGSFSPPSHKHCSPTKNAVYSSPLHLTWESLMHPSDSELDVAVKRKAGFITPVPGGVGPVTVAMLLKNTLLAAKKVIY